MAMNIFYNEWTLLNSWMWLLHCYFHHCQCHSLNDGTSNSDLNIPNKHIRRLLRRTCWRRTIPLKTL